MGKLGFSIFGGCVVCAIVACSGGDQGGLRRATHDAGEALDASRDAGEAEVRHWVGSVEGTDIRVGAVIDRGERARIFFCGGPTSYQTATRWIALELGDGGSYAYEDSDWRVFGRVEAAAIRGEVELGGRESAVFSAEPIANGTIAGLYEGRADCGRIGLIVSQPDPSGEPTGQGACVGTGHPPEQVNPILPIALVDGRIRVAVGETETSVQEAGLSAR